MNTNAATRARNKIERCVLLAREVSRYSWQIPKTRGSCLAVKREAMSDARYWRAKLHALQQGATPTDAHTLAAQVYEDNPQ